MKRLMMIILAAMMLLPAAVFADDTNTKTEVSTELVATAEDLSKECEYNGPRGLNVKYALKDNDYDTATTLYKNDSITISWNENVPVSSVLVEFYRTPGSYTIIQYDANGKKLSGRKGIDGLINEIEYVSVETRSVKIVCSGNNELVVCGLKAYGEGEIQGRHKWMPTPKKLDYLVVAMHPDDDVIFLGAIMPIYTGELGYVGSSLVMATNNRTRKDEYLNGEWVLGQRTAPLCGGFPDIGTQANAKPNSSFREDRVVPYLVRVIRQYKPEVVFSQDLNGEYGHWQHRRLALWTKMAVPLAADPSYDPESAEKFGTWEVKKHYIHLYEENAIKIDVTSPLNAFGGSSAFEVATEAFKCHKTQNNGHHWVKNEGVYSMSDFGLTYTTVGPDTKGLNDPFEHTGIISKNEIRWRIEECAIQIFTGIRMITRDSK